MCGISYGDEAYASYNLSNPQTEGSWQSFAMDALENNYQYVLRMLYVQMQT